MMTETIKTLENTLAAFAMAVRSAAIDWEYKPSADKWSNKEILGHLTDSAQINMQRFIKCTYEENFKLIYDQNEWVNAQAYQLVNISDLISLWMALNKQMLHLLKNYPLDRLNIKCDTGKGEEGSKFNTVEFLCEDYVMHMRHHLNQILEG